MSITNWLGSVFDPEGADAVRRGKADIDSLLAPGSDYYKAGNLGLSDPGSTGNTLINSLAAAKAHNASANFTPMDQDSAALSKLGSTFGDQFAHGGKAEAAARNRAIASMADAGGGGLAGVKNLTQASQQLSQQAEQTALSERGQNASLENSSNLEAGMLQVRKAAFQAALTHANMQKNNAAQALTNSLTNQQAANDLALRGGAIQGQHAENQISLGQQQSDNNIALGVVNTAASAVGAASATGMNAFGSSASGNSVDTSVSPSDLQAATAQAYQNVGINPSTLPSTSLAAPAITGQAAALTTQNALNQALGTNTSKITYPTLQSDVSNYLTDPSAYPLTSSMR